MKFETAPPPQWRAPASVRGMMLTVLLALGPALVAYIWFYGAGIVLNILVARLRPRDGSRRAPPARPAARHLSRRRQRRGHRRAIRFLPAAALPVVGDGGRHGVRRRFCQAPLRRLGYNLFNPAMAGYVLVLVSFPQAMTVWPAPFIGDIDYVQPDLAAALVYTLTGSFPGGLEVDAVARATVLDSVREGLSQMRTMDEIRASPLFGDFGGEGWEWINNFVALGGLWLLYAGIIRWQIPTAMLAGLLVPATVVWLLDPGTHPSPGLHLFSGGAILGAFFIATDPVSAPATGPGRLIYAAGIGLLTFVIRQWGSYADGVAFAVLLMNMTVPLIDRCTRPRIYGRASR